MFKENKKFTFGDVESVIKENCFNCSNETVKGQILEQLKNLLLPDIFRVEEYFLTMELKNTMRNYGTKSIETLNNLEFYL